MYIYFLVMCTKKAYCKQQFSYLVWFSALMRYMLYHQNYLLMFILYSLNFPGHGKRQLG